MYHTSYRYKAVARKQKELDLDKAYCQSIIIHDGTILNYALGI